MKLRDIPLKTEYRSGNDNVIAELYSPALSCCHEYWRAVGYFNSGVLEYIGLPLVDFINAKGKIRLITSVHLAEEDIKAIQDGLEKNKIIQQKLDKIITEEIPFSLGPGTTMLVELLAIGRLEIKIAMPSNGKGIYHEKLGIFFDSDDYIVFFGSANETICGLDRNYECIDTYTSWADTARSITKKTHFEKLWKNQQNGVDVFEFPEASKRKLIQVCTSNVSIQAVPSNNKWKHQDEAVELFLQKKRGILEMATGTGKTRTALRICKCLITSNLIGTILISADGNDLLDQWYKQIHDLNRTIPSKFVILRHYGDYHDIERFSINANNRILLASRQILHKAMYSLNADLAKRTFLIHDEVHRLGSPSNRNNLKGLSDNITYRLGLSATPEREYDDEGNKFIEQHIGQTIFKFGLEEAIKHQILCPFNYWPLEYLPDQEDREKLQNIYKMVSARKLTGNPMTQEDVWIALSKVYKTSKAKFAPFLLFIDDHQDFLVRCIVFVETIEYGQALLKMIHSYRHDFHTYFADDDSDVLNRFAGGELECLVTCHRVSEGIDIKSLASVILFSSSRAKLETIQRIGRCLRVDPNNPLKRANIIDFIRIDKIDETNPDIDRRDWLSHLATIEPQEKIS